MHACTTFVLAAFLQLGPPQPFEVDMIERWMRNRMTGPSGLSTADAANNGRSVE